MQKGSRPARCRARVCRCCHGAGCCSVLLRCGSCGPCIRIRTAACMRAACVGWLAEANKAWPMRLLLAPFWRHDPSHLAHSFRHTRFNDAKTAPPAHAGALTPIACYCSPLAACMPGCSYMHNVPQLESLGTHAPTRPRMAPHYSPAAVRGSPCARPWFCQSHLHRLNCTRL